MMEWMTRDPLNGLVITIAFFLSVIIGRYFRKTSTRMSRNNTIEPRIKLITSLLLIIAVTSMRNWYFPVIISILCIIFALKFGLIWNYSKKLVFPLILGLFILAIQGLTLGVNKIAIGNIYLYSEGIMYGFLIFSRVIASASVLILLILTTSTEDMLRNLRWLRVPGTMLDISSFMSRYIRTFSHEGNKLKLAQESRCSFYKNTSYTEKVRDIASICGLLITRALARSEEVYRAMISRGWKPQIQYSNNDMKLDPGDKVIGIIISSGILALVIFDRFL